MTNIFEGKLVRLRAEEPTDKAAFRRWVQEDTESSRLIYRIPFPESSVQAAAGEPKAPQGDNFDFVIETLGGEVVGGIDPHDCDPRCGTFMYGIGIFPEHRRKGYSSEALRLMLGYLFRERRYQKCTVEVFSFNLPSIRLQERFGFTLEGRLRRTIYSEGAYHDSLFFGMTTEEFETIYGGGGH
ncbi:MAG: GNAT family protein [Chloroflexota bacterium]